MAQTRRRTARWVSPSARRRPTTGGTATPRGDQAAVAGKILYDAVVWGTPVPSMHRVLAAYQDIEGWVDQAQGATGRRSSSSAWSAVDDDQHLGRRRRPCPVSWNPRPAGWTGRRVVGDQRHVQLADRSDVDWREHGRQRQRPRPGVPVRTGSDDHFRDQRDCGRSTRTSATGIRRRSSRAHSSSWASRPSSPLEASQQFTSNAQPGGSGTLSIRKSGDDTAYVGVLRSNLRCSRRNAGRGRAHNGRVWSGWADRTTGRSSRTSYTKTTAPSGYQTSSSSGERDRRNEYRRLLHRCQRGPRRPRRDHRQSDAEGGAPRRRRRLRGPGIRRPTTVTTTRTSERRTTSPSGQCSPPGNHGSGLLPGITRSPKSAPRCGLLPRSLDRSADARAGPGESGSVTFSDFQLGSMQVEKAGDDVAYNWIAGAVFSVSGPLPSTAAGGSLTIGANGQSNTLDGLVPGSYVLTETQPPPGYQAVALQTVSVTAGHVITTVDVLDHVQPATVSFMKIDCNGAPWPEQCSTRSTPHRTTASTTRTSAPAPRACPGSARQRKRREHRSPPGATIRSPKSHHRRATPSIRAPRSRP